MFFENKNVTIPNTVTSIGVYAFHSCSNLSSVNFFNSNLSYIGAGAFASCSSLSSINIPNSVTSIGSVAFAGCGRLTSIDIPNSVVSIEGQAFQYCRSLTSVTLPQNATISNSAFENAGNTISVDNIIYKSGDNIPLTIVGNYTFNNTGIFLTFYLNETSYNNHDGGGELMVYWFEENISNNVIIPSTINFNENVYSITSIDRSAFSNCSILTSITIPNSITSIGEEAFYNCNNLTSVTCLGNNPPLLDNNAFRDTPLNKVLFSPFCSIENYANSNWNNYFDINIKEDGLTYVYNHDNTLKVIDCVDTITSVVIPSNISNETCSYNVTEIGNSAFYNCSNLTSITIGNNITSIKDSAFYGCSSLTTLNFNAINCNDFNSNNHPFSDCSISTITIGDNVQRIPNYFAYNNSLITSIDIPNSVTSIGISAFYNCDGLTSIIIPNSVTSIGNSAFSDCSGLTTLNFNAINCEDFSSSNPFSDSPINTINIGDGVQRIPNNFAYTNSLITYINVPNSVSEIGTNAFNGCSNVLSISLGNSVTSLGDSAFYGCSNITSIDIPSSVTEISVDAFNGCDMMMLVNLGENLSFIGSNAFNGCAFLQSVNCLATIPPTLQGSSVFPNPNTATLTVPCGSLDTYSSATSFWNILFNGRIEEDCEDDSGIEQAEETLLSFFPNPTKSEITFSQAIEKVEVIDLTGKTIFTFSNVRTINIESLPSGAYYLRLTNDEKTIMQKVIKQ